MGLVISAKGFNEEIYDSGYGGFIRFRIDLAKAYSNFYNENKIITDDKKIQNTRVFLTYATGNILKIGAGLLGIEMPDKM